MSLFRPQILATRFKRAVVCGLVGTSMVAMTTSIASANFVVDVKTCASPKGSIATMPADMSVWDALGANDPTAYIRAMVAQSNCFSLADPGTPASYTLAYGPLSQEQFDAGPNAFVPNAQNGGSGGASGMNGALDVANSGLSGINDALSGNLSGLNDIGKLFGSNDRMRHVWVEVRNSAGQVVARGFGRNNRADLDVSHWAYDQVGVEAFGSNKKSRRVGGAIYNAFTQAQDTILSADFGVPVSAATTQTVSASGSAGGSHSSSGSASGGVFIGDLEKERSQNRDRFKANYANPQSLVLHGYVTSLSGGSSPYVTIGQSAASSSTTDGASCGGMSESDVFALNEGDPVTVSGAFAATQSSFVSRLFSNDCRIVGPWDPSQQGSGQSRPFNGQYQAVGTILQQRKGNSFGFYRRNEGKAIGVSGPVSRVYQGDNGGIFVILKEASMEGFDSQVSCEISSSQSNSAADLLPGETIRLSGVVEPQNRTSGLSLSSCRID